MRVKTKTAVPINIKNSLNEQVTSVLYMEVNKYEWNADHTLLTATGKYYYDDEGTNKVAKTFDKEYSNAEIDALYNTLSPTSDPSVSKSAFDLEVKYLAGLKEMASSWGYNEADLEIEE